MPQNGPAIATPTSSTVIPASGASRPAPLIASPPLGSTLRKSGPDKCRRQCRLERWARRDAVEPWLELRVPAASVDLRAGQLDQLRVFLVVCFQPHVEFLRRAEPRIERLARQTLADIGHPERLVDFGIEPADNGLGRPRRREYADPGIHLVTGNSGLGDRRYAGQRARAFGR